MTQSVATHSGTFKIGGELEVNRLGFGSMQLPGEGVWGPPADREAALGVLRATVELGINLIDTADAYGPHVAEQLIHDALHPYKDDLVIATKAGLTRQGPGKWTPLGRPAYLRQQVELSLRNFELERIGLFQLHRIDPEVPLEDQVGELKALQDEGKIAHIGLSEVSVDQLKAAQQVAEIASVQNLYNLTNRDAEPLLDYCTEQNIGFIPWFPLATGKLSAPGGPLDEIASKTGHSPSQLALAWLLKRSPVMLPIPGTKSVDHLRENAEGASIELSDEDFTAIGRAAG
jgi:aryl-alcohol dehydrogenase-like predicted oxidoreductase